LLFTPGELGRFLPLQLEQTQSLQQFIDPPAYIIPIPTPMQNNLKLLAGGESRKQIISLKNETSMSATVILPLRSVHLPEIPELTFIIHQNLPGIRFEQAGKDRQECRFARAARTHQQYKLPRIQLQGALMEDHPTAVPVAISLDQTHSSENRCLTSTRHSAGASFSRVQHLENNSDGLL
jgi:hypothetical protein